MINVTGKWKLWASEPKRREYVAFVARLRGALDEVEDLWKLGERLHSPDCPAGVHLFNEEPKMHGELSDIVSRYIVIRLCALFDSAKTGRYDNLSVNGLKRLLSDKGWEVVEQQLERFEEAVKAVEHLREIRNRFLAHNDYASWKRSATASFAHQEISDVLNSLRNVHQFLDGLAGLKGIIEVEIDEGAVEAPAEWNHQLVLVKNKGDVNITLPDGPWTA